MQRLFQPVGKSQPRLWQHDRNPGQQGLLGGQLQVDIVFPFEP